MVKIDNGGPAFPCTYANGAVADGLTHRDWFATFAPEPSQGLITKEVQHDRTRRELVFRSIDEIIADLKI